MQMAIWQDLFSDKSEGEGVNLFKSGSIKKGGLRFQKKHWPLLVLYDF